jgi:hypothetical protein
VIVAKPSTAMASAAYPAKRPGLERRG